MIMFVLIILGQYMMKTIYKLLLNNKLSFNLEMKVRVHEVIIINMKVNYLIQKSSTDKILKDKDMAITFKTKPNKTT